MKNKAIAALIALALLFSGFTGGFFLGRNLVHPSVLTARIAPVIEFSQFLRHNSFIVF